jgi:hypothetical protein
VLSKLMLCLSLLFGVSAAIAEEPAPDPDGAGENGEKVVSGMSIVGNDDAPKSLVIVPWKSSELGTGLDISRMLGDGRGPVDKDVFMRELSYYEIRVE